MVREIIPKGQRIGNSLPNDHNRGGDYDTLALDRSEDPDVVEAGLTVEIENHTCAKPVAFNGSVRSAEELGPSCL
jgi:hypothetical protein